MPDRDAVPTDFVGKTIARIDTRSCNVWRFEFLDGTKIAIEAELFHGIPIMQVCEECGEREPADDENDLYPEKNN